MKCVNCQDINPTGARFCRGCGADLATAGCPEPSITSPESAQQNGTRISGQRILLGLLASELLILGAVHALIIVDCSRAPDFERGSECNEFLVFGIFYLVPQVVGGFVLVLATVLPFSPMRLILVRVGIGIVSGVIFGFIGSTIGAAYTLRKRWPLTTADKGFRKLGWIFVGVLAMVSLFVGIGAK